MISFAAPWLLAALAVLPFVWWLLRVSPPAPRRQVFPAVTLLLGLEGAETTPARTPWWLLALRLAAAALVIFGLAQPIRDAPPPALSSGPALSTGPVLLVIDDGWAAAADWSSRIAAAQHALAEAGAGSVPARLLVTADDPAGQAPAPRPVMTLADLPGRLASVRPMAWGTDRAAAARALADLPSETRVIYLADGVAEAGDAAFAAALGRFRRVIELRGSTPPMLLLPPVAEATRLDVRAITLAGHPGTVGVQAQAASGEILATTELDFSADGAGSASLVLPPDLRNRVASLHLADRASAGAVLLLDEASRRRPVGLVTASGGQDQPLTGPFYYLRRALAPTTELREGDLHSLLARDLSMIIIADQTITDPADLAALNKWLAGGGVLVRFAGPVLAAAAAPDPLLPGPLLAGDRTLGGAMSWSRPEPLAAFPLGSPFAGLAVPAEVLVSRQVLAEPGAAENWATLADGTPLVTAARRQAGRIVLFHVTANADWSNLPLSGLFVDMLRRLVGLSVGVAARGDNAILAPRQVLDGFGQLGAPGPAAIPIEGSTIGTTAAGPAYPPGLYGPADGARALNLGTVPPVLRAAAPIAGATLRSLAVAAVAHADGPFLLGLAALVLILDLLLSLQARGLWRRGAAVALVLALGIAPARADPPAAPSLATHLAYVVTNDGQADGISRAGLAGLSDYVNQRTAAVLAEPVGVDPARDDLSFYPLLYWPVLADAPPLEGAAVARLDDYMENGGIILFDTRDGAAPDAGAQAALQRIGAALSIPPLAVLTPAHVLGHSFYLLHDWPGASAGAPVWVARIEDQGNDGVSPVVIGANGWAAAWAVDDAGANPYDVSPGGEAQRVTAYRFGVNLVMYALTGNYKSDQLHVPELLRRMGEDAGAPPADPDGGP